MWSPKGQQVMIPTPRQPKVHYGLGAVNYHTGETVVIIRKRKRRLEVAELLQTLVKKHPLGRILVVWIMANKSLKIDKRKDNTFASEKDNHRSQKK